MSANVPYNRILKVLAYKSEVRYYNAELILSAFSDIQRVLSRLLF